MSNGVSLSTSNGDFHEVRSKLSTRAFFLGMAVIAISILVGAKYAFFIPFIVFSLLMTLLWWRKAPRPWIFPRIHIGGNSHKYIQRTNCV